MLRSMYSGISGMKVNQTKLDVIGNNIANVNTTSFKSSRATFSDLLSQSSSSAQASSATKGGINAKQIGLGVQLSSIDRIMTQGSMQTTSRSLDLGLDGNGYFMVSTGPAISADGAIEVSHKAGSHAVNEATLSASGASISYTRDGSFTLDNEGNLLTTDGYRVLGYSVTNDDNSQAATAKKPADGVKLGNLNFSFSAGTQLNGVQIQLGAIGAGTATSASLSKDGKTLTINGDFSSDSTLTSEQIQRSINEELASKGISQSVQVSGNITKINDLITESSYSQGTNATPPDSVSVLGYNIEFTGTAKANNYTIKIGNISTSDKSGTAQGGVKAELIGKDIMLYGNFIDGNITGDQIKEALNSVGLDEIVEKVTGKVSSDIKGLSTSVGNITLAAKNDIKGKATALGYTVEFTGYGSELNNCLVNFDNTGSGDIVVKGPSNGVITISGDLQNSNSTAINEAIKKSLDSQGIKSIFQVTGTYAEDGNKTVNFGNTGKSPETPSITIGGITISLPSTDIIADKEKTNQGVVDKIQGLKFKIGNTTADPVTAKLDNDTLIINGNFFSSGGVDLGKLETAINGALNTHLSGLKLKVGTSSSQSYGNLKSDKISGGEDFKNPDAINALGLSFKADGKTGATLNDYKIQVGTVAAGTQLGVNIDKNNKVIVINGDFVTPNKITAQDIEDKLNKELTNSFGSDVYMKVSENSTGSLLNLEGQTEANKKIEGGTSVQSITEDGTIRFVSASTTVKAYDNSLKTLKIPEKVMSSSGVEVAVKSYSIASNGVITATLQDGTIAALGQIALASFSNPAGLTSVGGNLYSVSSNSGSATIMSGLETTGEDNSKAYGSMLSGYLEMSNVDLAEQFTEMITTTKAFQGSSKMITTGDEILTEIINLKR
mgnify:CR=1 FL=1